VLLNKEADRIVWLPPSICMKGLNSYGLLNTPYSVMIPMVKLNL